MDMSNDTSGVFNMLRRIAANAKPEFQQLEDPEVLQRELGMMFSMRDDRRNLLAQLLGSDKCGIPDILDEMVQHSVKSQEEIKNLPVEDTIWLFDTDTPSMDEKGNLMRFIKIADQQDRAVGIGWGNPHEDSMASICLKALCVSCLQPWWGVPRRPRSITFRDPNHVAEAGDVEVSHLGINYMYKGQSTMVQVEYTRMRECSMCQLRGSRQLFKLCKSCQALLYCSKECQKKDWFLAEEGKESNCGHKFWCRRLKQYMAQADEMRALPFTFVKETCSQDWDLFAYKRFLEGQGVYNQGGWKQEVLPVLENRRKPLFGELPIDDDIYVLPVESCILDERLNGSKGPTGLIRDWESYYSQRGFRLDSPIAILLQWPLTAYYILSYCVPNDVPSWWDDLDCGRLSVDIVGVERELELLPVFKELGYLMPDVAIDIVMFGLTISKKIHNKIFRYGSVTIVVKRGLYEKQADSVRKPHVVIGFNAGLGAYCTWQKTVLKLRTEKIPAYFTDFCRYSCESSRHSVEKFNLGTISEPVINPFRSPVRHLADENDMPQYSNGFLFRLIYPS